MKDVAHHLKHIQKKVIKSVRKENQQKSNTIENLLIPLSVARKKKTVVTIL